MTTFQGLTIDGTTPAERRRAVLEASDETLADAVVDLCEAYREPVVALEEQIAQAGCIPRGELVASPFGFRANLIGILSGAAAVHQELRVPITGQRLNPRSSLFDPLHGEWQLGVRHVGKYQSFRHDEPFIVYNPNHMAKWTPHEMLHRALGFFFRSDMSRWELYLASRLNELVPVVHWYGTDEMLRLRHDGFVRQQQAAQPGARRRDAVWLTLNKGETERRARASLPLLRESVRRFEEELGAVRRELLTGYTQRVDHPFLDSSSDAIAYVTAHYERVTTPTVQAVLKQVVESEHRYDRIEDYLDATEQLFDTLLFGALEWNAPTALAKRNHRAIWDLILRGALHAEVDANCLIRGIAGAPRGFWRKMSNARVLLSEALKPGAKDAVMATGFAHSLNEAIHSVGPRAPLSLRSAEEILDGLESVVPVAMRIVDSDQLADFASSLEDSDRWTRERLVDRFCVFIAEQEGEDSPLAELIAFEAALYAPRPGNVQVQQLASWPGASATDAAAWLVIRSPSYGRYAFVHDVPGWHAQLAQGIVSEAPERRVTDVLIGTLDDAPCVVGICPAFVTVFEMMEESSMTLGDVIDVLEQGDLSIFGMEENVPEKPIDWVVELAEAQCIGLMPPVKRSP